MKKKFSVLGMLAMMLAFGLVFVSCDKSIDGTWVSIDDYVIPYSVKYIFDNGNFEFIAPEISVKGIHHPEWREKGIYAVEGNNLTITATSFQYDNDIIKIDEEEYVVKTGIIKGDEISITRELRVGEYETINFKKIPVVSDAKALVGTWEGGYGLTWSFTRNRFTQDMGGIKQTFPYKIKGNSISTQYQGAEVELEYEIVGDILVVDLMGFRMEFERVK